MAKSAGDYNYNYMNQLNMNSANQYTGIFKVAGQGTIPTTVNQAQSAPTPIPKMKLVYPHKFNIDKNVSISEEDTVEFSSPGDLVITKDSGLKITIVSNAERKRLQEKLETAIEVQRRQMQEAFIKKSIEDSKESHNSQLFAGMYTQFSDPRIFLKGEGNK